MAQLPWHWEDTLDTIASALVCCTWEYFGVTIDEFAKVVPYSVKL